MLPHDLMPLIRQQLATNQFLSGGAVLGSLAALGAYLRNVPAKLGRWLRNRFFIELSIDDNDEAFLWVINWLAMQRYAKQRARDLMVITKRTDKASLPVAAEFDEDDLHQEQAPAITLAPARGRHWLFYRRHLVEVFRGKSESVVPPAGSSQRLVLETLTLSVLTRNRALALQIIEDARNLAYPKSEMRTGILTLNYGDWITMARRQVRPLDSVILSGTILEDCLDLITKFRAREDWYTKFGLPYRLGIEFEGPPGSGKSSAVAAIAGHFGLDLAILNLTLSGLSDDDLYKSLSNAPRSAIVLIEDIDCIYEGRSATSDKIVNSKLTFSGLLNALDGVAAAEGRILFITTNYHNKLDEALVRPGRIDRRFTIGAPDALQVERMFKRFFPSADASEAVTFVQAVGDPAKTSMAALQGVLINANGDLSQAYFLARSLDNGDDRTAV